MGSTLPHGSAAAADFDLFADDDAADYSSLVLGAANVAVVLFVAQGLASLIVANRLGITTEIRFLWGAIPYAAVLADGATFAPVVGWSTLLAVAVTCAGVGRSVTRHHGDPRRTYGWTAGLLMATVLIALQWCRLWLASEALDSRPLGIAMVLVVATGVVVRAMIGSRTLFDAPESAPVVEAPRPTSVTPARAVTGYRTQVRSSAASKPSQTSLGRRAKETTRS